MWLDPELDQMVKERTKIIRDLLTDKIETDIMNAYREALIHGESVINLDKDIYHASNTSQSRI
jgi:hypothetical protein